MQVKARKTPYGLLIPLDGELANLPDDVIDLEVTLLPREKTDKALVAEAAVERYLEKQRREVPSTLSVEEREEAYRRLGVEEVHSIEDALHRLPKN
ncbi:MAG: hypothetical protein KA419_07600 [Acidobacteria bacterium]|nr:hypothetical protein [Acidobacteriota bacterium]